MLDNAIPLQLTAPFLAALGCILLAAPMAFVFHHLSLLWVSCFTQFQAKRKYARDHPKGTTATCSATISADSVTAQIVSPQQWMEWLNPSQILTQMSQSHLRYSEDYVDDFINTVNPRFWALAPAHLRGYLYRHARVHMVPFLDDVLDNVIEKANQLFDYRRTLSHQYLQQSSESSSAFHCLRENSKRLLQKLLLFTSAFSVLCVFIGWLLMPSLEAFAAATSTQKLIGTAILISIVNIIGLQIISHFNPTPRQSKKNTTAARFPLPSMYRQAAQTAAHKISAELLDLNTHLKMLTLHPARNQFETIIKKHFRKWFFDTLPAPLLALLRGKHYNNTTLEQVAADSVMKVMDIPFHNDLFLQHRQIDVEQHMKSHLLGLTGAQFHKLLYSSFRQYYFAQYFLALLMIGSGLLFIF